MEEGQQQGVAPAGDEQDVDLGFPIEEEAEEASVDAKIEPGQDDSSQQAQARSTARSGPCTAVGHLPFGSRSYGARRMTSTSS